MSGVLLILLQLAPLVLDLWLANMADRQRARGRSGTGWAALSYFILGSVYAAMLLGGAGVLLLAATPQTGGQPAISSVIQSPQVLGWGMAISALLGIVLLLRPVRRLISYVLAIDPLATRHALALSYVALILAQMVLILGLGLETILAGLNTGPEGQNIEELLATTWVQELLWFLMAMVGVGFLSRRGPADSLRRLGLVPPSPAPAVVAIVVGIVMGAAVVFGMNFLVDLGLPLDENVRKLSERLIGPLARTLPGVITLGVAAAIGEESLFRGAIQPRFGLAGASILFALMHSNYGLTTFTVVVLVIGVVLGMLRNRFNTSTAMIAHAVYNMSQAGLDRWLSGT